MRPTGYVVSRPFSDSNVGSNLSSLAGAVWLAGRLSRALIVDWRGLSQLRDKSLNYFSEFFATPAQVRGVPVLYAPIDGAEYGESSEDTEWLSPGEARRVALGEREVGADYVVLQTYHGLDRIHPGPESERFAALRAFYRELRPSAAIQGAVDEWAAEHFGGAFVVGVNVRTGNGAYFGKGMRYAGRVDIGIFERHRRFLRALERACRARTRQLPRSLRDGVVVFYATDSSWMSELLAELPKAVTRRAVFPPPNTGDLYLFEGSDYTDRDSVVDTLVDMFLLARCDALVYNNSLFNQYARVLSGYFHGNEVHIESLFLRTRLQLAAAALRSRRG